MEFQGRSSDGMRKAQIRSMQEISIQRSEFFCEFFVAPFTVDIVAYDRMTDCSKVHTDLVGAPRFYTDLKK